MPSPPPPPIKSTTNSSNTLEIEALLNRVSLTLSRSQKLAESWIPLTPAEKDAQPASAGLNQSNGTNGNVKQGLGIDEGFLRPERAGLGAPLNLSSSDLSINAKTSALDPLRKQLLGRNAASSKTVTNGRNAKIDESKRKHYMTREARNDVQDDSSDEEEGRAGAFKSKRQKHERTTLGQTVDDTMAGAAEGNDVMGGVEEGTGAELSTFHEFVAPKPTGALLLRPSLATRQSLPRASKPTSYLDDILAAQAKKREKRDERQNKKWKARMEAKSEQMKQEKEPQTEVQQPKTPPLSTQPTADTLLSLSPLTLNALSFSEPDLRPETSGIGIEERMMEFAAMKERKKERTQNAANGTGANLASPELVVQDLEEKKLRAQKRAAEWLKKEGMTYINANGTAGTLAGLAREAQELSNKLRREKKLEARKQREEQKLQVANVGDVNMTGSTTNGRDEAKELAKRQSKAAKSRRKSQRRRERNATETSEAREQRWAKRAQGRIENKKKKADAELAAKIAVTREEKQRAATSHGDQDMGVID